MVYVAVMWRALTPAPRPAEFRTDTGEAERYYRRDVVKHRPPASRG